MKKNTENELETITSTRRTADYTSVWRATRIDPTAFGLDPQRTPGPAVMDSGVLIIARWRGSKSRVTLYRRHDRNLGIKMTMLASGKSISARLSEIDVPSWRTVAEVCQWASEHGYLRLRQPRETNVDAENTSGPEQTDLPIVDAQATEQLPVAV